MGKEEEKKKIQIFVLSFPFVGKAVLFRFESSESADWRLWVPTQMLSGWVHTPVPQLLRAPERGLAAG